MILMLIKITNHVLKFAKRNGPVITIIFSAALSVRQINASEPLPDDPVYLAETMECQFTEELIQLATNLNHDPVEIYNFVASEVSPERYIGSRKGAHMTYLTGHGNAFDQTSLLITLLRISGVPARYVSIDKFGKHSGAWCEAYVTVDNYRGAHGSGAKDWIPMMVNLRGRVVDNGIDLFSSSSLTSETTPATITAVGSPSGGGSVSVTADSKGLSYSPTPGFLGTEAFTYTATDSEGNNSAASVRVTVRNSGSTMVAVDDHYAIVSGSDKTYVSLEVVHNDIVNNETYYSIISVTDPNRGGTTELSQFSDEFVIYSPAPGFVGEESFQYTILNDGGSVEDTGRVNITVLAPNSPLSSAEDHFVVDSSSSEYILDVLANDQIFTTSIPSELDFDFNKYLNGESLVGGSSGNTRYKSTVELFEEMLQSYISDEPLFSGKSLKDIPRKRVRVIRKSSLLPSSLPKFYYSNLDQSKYPRSNYPEIPQEYRASVDLEVRNTNSNGLLLSDTIYFPEISGKRFVLDWITGTDSTSSPVFKINGSQIGPLGTRSANSQEFTVAWRLGGETTFTPRPSKSVGTLVLLAFDRLSVSIDSIQNLTDELSNLDVVLPFPNNSAREAYLGRMASIMAMTWLQRANSYEKRILELLHLDEVSIQESPIIIYTTGENLEIDKRTKFLLHPVFHIDAISYSYQYYNINDPERLDIDPLIHPLGKLVGKLVGFATSYDEARIFEDWLYTPGMSTVTGLMLAHDLGIPVKDFTPSHVVNGTIPDLQNPPNEFLHLRYSNADIDAIVAELQEHPETIVQAPVTKIPYDGNTAAVWFSENPDFISWTYDGDNGGGSIRDNFWGKTQSFFSDLKNVVADAINLVPNFVTEKLAGYFGEGNPEIGPLQEHIRGETLDKGSGEAQEQPGADRVAEGDPVDMVRREFYTEEHPDISIPGTGFALEVTRSYRSRMVYDGPFGYGWGWSHAEQLLFKENGDPIFYNTERIPHEFSDDNQDGVFEGPSGITFIIRKEATEYILLYKDGKETVFNQGGLLTRKTDANGNYLEFEYNTNFQINSIRDRVGRNLSLIYNLNGKVETVRDFSGRKCHYRYDDNDLVSFIDLQDNEAKFEYLKNQQNELNNHNMSKYILPNGDFLEIGYYKDDSVAFHKNTKGYVFNFQYSPGNRYAETWNESGYYKKLFYNDTYDVIRVTTLDKTFETRAYDDDHNLLSMTDGNGNTWTYTYDDNRNLTSVTDPLNHTTTYEYDLTFNKMSKFVDARGFQGRFYYNDKGNLTKQVDGLGYEKSFKYDEFGNMTSQIDDDGNITRFIYDSQNLYVVKHLDNKGLTTESDYDNIGRIISQTDPEGFTTTFDYNGYNQVTKTIDGGSNLTTFEYNDNRQLTTRHEPNGAISTNIYDTARDIVSGSDIVESIDSLGFSTTFEYDAVGNVISSTDQNGNTTLFRYDELNRLILTVDPYQRTEFRRYDGAGNLVQITDKRGNIYKFVYDKTNRKIEEVDPLGYVTKYEYDASGNLTRVINPKNIETRLEYDALNRVISQTEAHGTPVARLKSYFYNNLGRLAREIDPAGNTTVYDYDINGNRIRIRRYDDDFSQFQDTSFEYDSRNLLIRLTDQNGHSTRYKYDFRGNKIGQIDPLGNRTEWGYDPAGNLSKHIQPNSASTQHHYNLRNEKILTIDALGKTKSFDFDGIGNLVGVTDEQGNKQHFYYDTLNRKIADVNAAGHATVYEYDENSNLVVEVGPQGYKKEFTYDKNNNLIKETYASAEFHKFDEFGALVRDDIIHSTVYEYDELNRLTKKIDPYGNPTEFSYDEFNKRTLVADALNNQSTYQYDQRGLLDQSTDPRGTITKYEYDYLGRMVRILQGFTTGEETETHYEYDAVGNRTGEIRKLNDSKDVSTIYEYDERNLLTKQTRKGDPAVNEIDITLSYEYDNRGLRVKEFAPEGGITYFQHDLLGRQTAVVGPEGDRTSFQYDERGNLTLRTQPNGEQITYEYNEENQRIRTVQDGRQKSTFYNEKGLVEKEINFNQITTFYEYNYNGFLTREISASGTPDEVIYCYYYDANGNLLSRRIDNESVDRYAYRYDELNRVRQEIDGNGRSSFRQYDSVGNLILVTRRDNTVISRQYDRLNRLTRVTVNNHIRQSFTYDNLSRILTADEFNEIGAFTNQVVFEYDSFNRVVKETQNAHDVLKSYDSNSNLKTLLYPSRKQLEIDYNKKNEATKIYDQYGNIVNYTDYINDKVHSAILDNGFDLTIDYDRRGQEKRRRYNRQAITPFSADTGYDDQGNITKETILNFGVARTTSYDYDPLNRIETATDFGQVSPYEKWDYNDLGNWTYTTQNGFSENRQSNSANEYAGTNYNYDNNGNLTYDGNQSYEYDWKNRLTSVFDSDDNVIVEIAYDALNRRVTKYSPEAGETVRYIYHNDQVIEEYINDRFDRAYVYGAYIDDVLLMENAAGNRYFYIKDRQFNIRAISDASGNLVETYDYSAFGLVDIYDTQDNKYSQSTIGNPYGYTGRRWDSEVALWHFRNRAYSPTLGRFLQRDPAGFVDGLNLYAYVKNNPLRFLDPMGWKARDGFALPNPVEEILNAIQNTYIQSNRSLLALTKTLSDTFNGGFNTFNPLSAEFAVYELTRGTLKTAGLTAGIPTNFLFGDIYDTPQTERSLSGAFTAGETATIYTPGVLTNDDRVRDAVEEFSDHGINDLTVVSNKTHFFGIGDLLQVLANELGVTDITQIRSESVLNAANASGVSTINLYAHSQGVEVTHGGLSLADSSSHERINLIGLGGQTTIYNGEFNVQSIRNVRAVDNPPLQRDPVPILQYANPINLVRGAVNSFDVNIETIRSTPGFNQGIDRHNVSNYLRAILP